MDMIISVIVLAAAATLSFMSFVTLKKQMEAVREENRSHWKSVEYSLEIQSNQISNEIQEGKTFNDNAFVALNENITASRKYVAKEVIAVVQDCDYSNASRNSKLLGLIKDTNKKNEDYYNKLREQVEGHDQDVADDHEILEVAIKDMHRKLSHKINNSVEEINKVTAQQVGRIIYLAPVIDMSAYAKVTGKRHGN